MIAEKGLACEERDVSLPQSEHKEPWFMRLNLGEEVPVIIHRDNIISDYDQIIDYVERTFTGGTAAAQAQTAPGSLESLGTHPPAATPDPGLVSPTRNHGLQAGLRYRTPRARRSPGTRSWSAGAVASSRELRSHRLGCRLSGAPQARAGPRPPSKSPQTGPRSPREARARAGP